MLLGTAYAASVGGVGTIIGTPPNAILVGQLNAILDYEIGFADWFLIGFPVVVVTLPLVWFILTYVLYPPEIPEVGARATARDQLEAMGELDPRGKRVAAIFAVTAGLWMLGGLGEFFEPYLSSVWLTTLFGGDGMTVFGVEGHQGLLYYVMVGVAAIPALVLADTMEWDELVDIDWGTLLLFGGGISLANALADTGATEWIADTVFGGLVGAPIVLVIGAVVLVVIFLTEMTSNSATTSIIVPILISPGERLLGNARADRLLDRALSLGRRCDRRQFRLRAPSCDAAQRHRVRQRLRQAAPHAPDGARSERNYDRRPDGAHLVPLYVRLAALAVVSDRRRWHSRSESIERSSSSGPKIRVFFFGNGAVETPSLTHLDQ